MNDPVEKRLDELESRLAFQDDTIETLNETITRQDRELLRLELQIKSIADKLRDLAEASDAPSDSQGHEVPPHY